MDRLAGADPGWTLALSLVYGGAFLTAAVWGETRKLDQPAAAAAVVVACYVPAAAWAPSGWPA